MNAASPMLTPEHPPNIVYTVGHTSLVYGSYTRLVCPTVNCCNRTVHGSQRLCAMYKGKATCRMAMSMVRRAPATTGIHTTTTVANCTAAPTIQPTVTCAFAMLGNGCLHFKFSTAPAMDVLLTFPTALAPARQLHRPKDQGGPHSARAPRKASTPTAHRQGPCDPM